MTKPINIITDQNANTGDNASNIKNNNTSNISTPYHLIDKK